MFIFSFRNIQFISNTFEKQYFTIDKNILFKPFSAKKKNDDFSTNTRTQSYPWYKYIKYFSILIIQLS